MSERSEARQLARAERRAGQVELHPETTFERGLWWVFRGALVWFARLWFGVRVEGGEHIPTDGPFILAPVHRSNVDFMVVLLCAKRRMRYLAKDTLWKPGWGRLFSALGGIPVARGTADREALRACIAVIEMGEPLVVFPEGTRQEGPEVRELFDGPAFVQARTGAPIVPVGIGGSAQAMPKGAKSIHRVPIRMLIGRSLEAPVLASGDGNRARRSATRAQTARLKTAVQALYDEAQRQAGTPN